MELSSRASAPARGRGSKSKEEALQLLQKGARGRSWAVDNPSKYSSMLVAGADAAAAPASAPQPLSSTIFGVATSFQGAAGPGQLGRKRQGWWEAERGRRKAQKGGQDKEDDEIAISSLLQLWGELNQEDQKDSFSVQPPAEAKLQAKGGGAIIEASWAQAGAAVVPAANLEQSQEHLPSLEHLPFPSSPHLPGSFASAALSNTLRDKGLRLECSGGRGVRRGGGGGGGGGRPPRAPGWQAAEEEHLVVLLEEHLVDQKLIEGLALAAVSPPAHPSPSDWSF